GKCVQERGGNPAQRPGWGAYRGARAQPHQPDGGGMDAAPAVTAEAGFTKPRQTMGLRWVSLVMRAPILATVGVVAILGTLAIPALSLDLNLPDGGSEPEGSTQREAYDLVSEGFGPGFNGPLVVAVDITQTTDFIADLESIGDRLGELDDVASVSQGIPDPGLDTAIIQVTPESAPDAAETKDLVQAIRDIAPELQDEFDTAITVTGTTAVGIDISNRLTNALVPFGLIVVGLSIVLLMMVFRSVLVPIKAALGFLLSVVASFGVVVAIFQWGWFSELLNVENPGPILSFMPILLMAVLFGLAMDYEVFLVSGMREEFVKSGNARSAVRRGFGNGARVVTAAALIMFFVFFAFVPEGSGTIKPIALGLAVGIAFDAFLVRMTLVPAVMTLLGRSAWWLPAWLGRLLPDMDIEGEKLREHREAIEWAETQTAAQMTARELVVGTAERGVGPIDLSVPQGALVLTSGAPLDRRLLAATLAGRLEPVSGLAQVAGHPLPSEMSEVGRLVAIADTGRSDRGDGEVTIGELISERLELTGSVFRSGSLRSQAAAWTQLVTEAIERSAATRTAGAHAAQGAARTPVAVTPDTLVSQLPQLERAVALAAAAIAERTPVVMLDLSDPFADPADTATFLDIVSRLAPVSTTVIVGSSATAGTGTRDSAGRPVIVVAIPGGPLPLAPSAAASIAKGSAS
ncbi:MMPL family transporter, partial [Marisediminicola senii]|uniref:MMPL family transporter n=1 Tax=Marisediminicola senii TaxID=2711233 RepID=UPI0013EBF2E3